MNENVIQRLVKFYNRTQWIIIFLVMFPTIFSTAAGIVMLTLYENPKDIVFGVLIITFTAAIIFGASIATYMARKAAKLATKQSIFIANISHELRSPLTVIKLYAQMLNEGYDEKIYKLCVEQILESGAKLENLVNQILLWKKLSGNKDFFNLLETDGNIPAKEAAKTFKTTHIQKNCNFTENYTDQQNTLIHIDSYAISRAIYNLLDNAYKYSGNIKNITLTTSIKTIEDKKFFSYEVSDNGIGIEPTETDKIYDEFYRINQTISGYTGIGIGLSIVQTIVREHGGKLNVNSKPGSGSAFEILIPYKKEKQSKEYTVPKDPTDGTTK